ncbi:MAG: hypothetical protein MJ252_22805 [archaeon]|nr:hypothetical protein [archaeon]
MFIALTVLNFLILITYVLCFIFSGDTLVTKIFCLVFSFFADFVCIIFLIIGLKIKKSISEVIKETNEAEEEGRRTVFDDTRSFQISILIYSSLPCSLYQTVFVILREFILKDDFEKNHFTFTAKTKTTFYLDYGFMCSILILTFVTYVAFYWLIREVFNKNGEYQKNGDDIKISLETSSLYQDSGNTEKFLDDDTTLTPEQRERYRLRKKSSNEFSEAIYKRNFSDTSV